MLWGVNRIFCFSLARKGSQSLDLKDISIRKVARKTNRRVLKRNVLRIKNSCCTRLTFFVCSPVLNPLSLSAIVDMLSKGFLTTWINFALTLNLSSSCFSKSLPTSVDKWEAVNQPNLSPRICKVKKSLSKLKFSNTIGYHQPDLNTNRKVYALCL